MFDQISSILGKVFETYATERLQYMVYIGLSLVILIFTSVLFFSDSQVFQRFLGNIHPIKAFLAAISLGFLLLSVLLTKKWFAIFETGSFPGMLRFSGLAALLGVIMILVDTRIIFPAGINIRFPQSLLFYPAMGFFVEILFHVLPLTVFTVTLNSILKSLNFNTIVWISIFIISVAEPIYQMMDMVSSKQFPWWAVAYVGVHLFLFNVIQMMLFKKYDFITMYSFRLVYYLFWHIIWGPIRLAWLF